MWFRKKMIAVRLCLVLAVSFAGCNHKTETSNRASKRINHRFSTGSVARTPGREQAFVKGTRGMANLGNTCYFNSALQILTHSEPFIGEVRGFRIPESVDLEPDSRLPQLVKSLVTSHWEDSKDAIVPIELFDELSRLDPVFFRVGIQQDANEMISNLFGELYRRLFGVPNNPVDLFRFQGRQTRRGLTVDEYPMSSLNVGLLPEDEDGVDLGVLIARYFEPGTEQNVLLSTPTLLLVNLQRGARTNKLHYPISFPSELGIQAEEASPVRYTLVGIVHHSGATWGGGHYYSDIYHYPSKSWYRANDSVVSKLDTDFPAQGSATARLFLYQLV